MADKELRRMNRTELIEIIYALQQNENNLRTENEELKEQLDDKAIRIERAGSIAEAALSLNHIFEDAQSAAEQYSYSLQSAYGQADEIVAAARAEADQIITQAQAQAREILAAAGADYTDRQDHDAGNKEYTDHLDRTDFSDYSD